MMRVIEARRTAHNGHNPYDRLDGRAHARRQVHRAITGLGLLALSLLFVTVLAIMQGADNGFWWPLVAWMQR
jgi:hypothetical protein